MPSRFSDVQSDSAVLLPNALYERDPTIDYKVHRDILYAMATCHSLKVVDGEIIGDPLDVKMFEFTRWSFAEVAQKSSNVDEQALSSPSSIAKPPVGQHCIIDEGDGNPAVSDPCYRRTSIQ